MKYKLSVLVPGIRTQNWYKLYDSLNASLKNHTWEMVFIGPYELPKELKGYDNITYIQDWGTPMRCQQRGLCIAKGEYITWAADDGVFQTDALDIGFKKLEGKPVKALVMGKYLEGLNVNGSYNQMKSTGYYILNNHMASDSKFFDREFFMLNVGIVPTALLIDVGGWDCQFEVCPMAYNDLAIRLQRYGVEFIIQDEIMFRCSHLPGRSGDHGPIHDAQITKDQPRFKKIYDKRESTERIVIDLNTWKNSPERWERRFGNNDG